MVEGVEERTDVAWLPPALDDDECCVINGDDLK